MRRTRRTATQIRRAQQRRRQATWLAGVSLMFAAGCGTQVEDARIEAVGNGYNAPLAGAAGTVAAPGAAATGTDTTGAATGAASGAAPGAGAVTAPGAGTAGSSGSTAPGSTAAGPAAKNAGKSTSAAGAGTGGTAPAACTKSLSPIVLGQTLATSGIIGATIGNLRQGAAIWAKEINARGGLQCHPVQLIALDDGSDASRVASNWNSLKGRGMVAMVGGGEPITIGALRASAERDKIPVIGGDLVSNEWFESQYLFPQGVHPFTAYDGSTVDAAKARVGAKNLGVIYCVEASICSNIKNNMSNSAKISGLNLAASKAASLTQSDFTAECQAFKDAKVDIVWLALDGSANTRFARSCASLNYLPQLTTSAIGIPPAAAADPSLQKLSVYLGSQTVPFDTKDTPAAKAFHAALTAFAPGFTPDQNTMAGYASGKLLEAALAKVADKARAGDVTTQLILEGLWELKNEKLGGLSPGVTFAKGGLPKAPRCYYTLLLDTKGVTSPFGSRLSCL